MGLLRLCRHHASTADYQISGDKLERRHKSTQTRGLNQLQPAVESGLQRGGLEALKTEAFKKIYERLTSGVRAEMARLTIARKLAAVALAIWKSGEGYDETKLSKLAA